MSKKIDMLTFKTMQSSTQKTECLVEVVLIMITIVFATKLNALLEEASDQTS